MSPGGRRTAPATPFDRALRLLAVRDRSRTELVRRLRRAEVSPADIDATLERLGRLGYLDDERFARSRAKSLLGGGKYGPRAVAFKLAQAGVAAEVRRAAVAEAMTDGDELTSARELLGHKYPSAAGSADPRLKARALRFLLGRGFSPSVARKLLRASRES